MARHDSGRAKTFAKRNDGEPIGWERSAARSAREIETGGGCTTMPKQGTELAARQPAVSEANRRARDAQRASASEGARDCSGNRSAAEIGAESPVAKRRAQKQKRNRRHRHNRRQHRRNLRKVVVLLEEKKWLGRLRQRSSGGAAAALRKGGVAAQWTGAVKVHSMFCTRARREPGVRERERRRRQRRTGLRQ